MVAATDTKLGPTTISTTVLAFDKDGEQVVERDVPLDVTDRDQLGAIGIAIDVPERLPKGGRLYLRFDLPALLRRVLSERET